MIFTKITVNQEECIFLLLSRAFFGFEKDIILCNIYIPPINSTRHTNNSKTNIDTLEDAINDIIVLYPNANIMLCGDFNARISEELDYIENDTVNFLFDANNVYTEEDINKSRKSKDKVVNTYGRRLLLLCKMFNIHVLNGRGETDAEGEYTFVGPMGCSVVDYVIASTSLFNEIANFEVVARVESNHLPICWSLNTNTDKRTTKRSYGTGASNDNSAGGNSYQYTKYKWKDMYSIDFISNLNSHSCLEILTAAKDCITINCNLAIELITQALQSAAQHIVVTVILFIPQK
jgi:hypothetical protein